MKKHITIHNKSSIWIFNYHPTLKLPLSKKSIIQLIFIVFSGERIRKILLNMNFITDSKIMQINKNFLNHNYVTDIITFPYLKERSSVDGEMFISLDRVKENSKTYRSGYLNEFKRVIIHGCLHLAGFEDENKKKVIKIRNRENHYLNY